MRTRTLATTVVVCLLALSAPRAATPQMPISEIRPGMVGIGRTVFNGTHVEEFRANILGVIENVIGPQRNLILARLEGGPLADEVRVVHAVEAESEEVVRTTLGRDPWSETHLRIDTIESWTIRLNGRRA